MEIIEENNAFKLNVSKEELTYNLESLLKANNYQLKLKNIEEIKRISENTAKRLIDMGPYPFISSNNGMNPAKFYEQTRKFWYIACESQIALEYSCKK